MTEKDRQLNELFEVHYPAVSRYCSVKLNGDRQAASDCMDEVFVRAKERADELLSHPDPRGWFFKTANNVIHELYREHRKRSRLVHRIFTRDLLYYVQPHFYTREQRFIAEIWSVEPEAFGPDMTDEELESIKREILAGFSEDDGELLHMSLEKKLTPDKIAALRGTSVGAVRVKLARLYDKLAMAVHERFDDVT